MHIYVLARTHTHTRTQTHTHTHTHKHKHAHKQVVRKMKHEKLINIIRILSMLSFFLDQVAFLKEVSQGGADGDDAKGAVTEAQWQKLLETTDPKMVEDLEALFVAYDEDDRCVCVCVWMRAQRWRGFGHGLGRWGSVYKSYTCICVHVCNHRRTYAHI